MHKINFKPTPNIKPMNVPNADLKDFLYDVPAIISPINAPKNGQSIIPSGIKNKPAIMPIAAPHTPAAVPPNFFAPSDGTR